MASKGMGEVDPDFAAQCAQEEVDSKVEEIRIRARNTPEGPPGECDLCGEDMPRLIKGACTRCRDKYRMP